MPLAGATCDEKMGGARVSADARASADAERRLVVSTEAMRSPLGTAAPTFQAHFQGHDSASYDAG